MELSEELQETLQKFTAYALGIFLGYVIVTFVIDAAFTLHVCKLELKRRRINVAFLQVGLERYKKEEAPVREPLVRYGTASSTS